MTYAGAVQSGEEKWALLGLTFYSFPEVSQLSKNHHKSPSHDFASHFSLPHGYRFLLRLTWVLY